ncbi:hypothetical protein ACFL7M_19325 [Thermodesulfobacteriota bacterium]
MKAYIKMSILSLLFFYPYFNNASAQYHYEITPSISLNETFDDNIYLDRTNEVSDFITTLSPAITMSIIAEKNDFLFRYSPSLVWYNSENRNNTVRQSGTLTYGHDLTEHVKFDLTDTYLQSEEPIEETEGVEGVRRDRNTYQRNTGRASLRFRFGPENDFVVGYGHSLLENDDIALDDGITQDPFANLTYWFNVKNGLELNYQYSKADFTRDDGTMAGDDYDGNTSGIRYIYRFSPQTTGAIGYNYSDRDFEGLTEDYKVHDGNIDFEHALSKNLSLALGGGYFIQKNALSDDGKGFSYDASMDMQFKGGHFTIGGDGGWDEAYLEAERRGFIKYWGINTNITIQFTETLDNYLGATYRKNKDADSRRWSNLSANYGFRWAFSRRFSLAVEYSCSARDDDVNTGDYNVNRVMLVLTGSRLFRW